MEIWKDSDIGKIIVYRKPFNDPLYPKETFAICRTYPESDFLGVIDYPIELSSRYQIIQILKNKEKLDESNLLQSGEWCPKGEVSKEELSVLEKISKEF